MSLISKTKKKAKKAAHTTVKVAKKVGRATRQTGKGAALVTIGAGKVARQTGRVARTGGKAAQAVGLVAGKAAMYNAGTQARRGPILPKLELAVFNTRVRRPTLPSDRFLTILLEKTPSEEEVRMG